MDTQVALHPDLPKTVHVASGIEAAIAMDPKNLFSESDILAVDGVNWGADFETIYDALSSKPRKFEDLFNDGQPEQDVAMELNTILLKVGDLIKTMYEGWEGEITRWGWRNMPSGPEPMHLDTYDQAGCPRMTIFVNVSPEPREYRVGWRLADLCEDQAQLIKDIWERCSRNARHFSVVMRKRWIEKDPPFDGEVPAHRIRFAPKSIWFFDAKMIFHEVVYGIGAISISWNVTNSEVVLQTNVLRRLRHVL